jgi:hypothetical protein
MNSLYGLLSKNSNNHTDTDLYYNSFLIFNTFPQTQIYQGYIAGQMTQFYQKCENVIKQVLQNITCYNTMHYNQIKNKTGGNLK